jgi:hypothetical protein
MDAEAYDSYCLHAEALNLCVVWIEKRSSSENRRFLLVAPWTTLCDAEKLIPVVFVGLLVAVAARDR